MSFYMLAVNNKTGFDFFLVEGGRVVKKCQITGQVEESHIVDVLTDSRCNVLLTTKQINRIMGRR